MSFYFMKWFRSCANLSQFTREKHGCSNLLVNYVVVTGVVGVKLIRVRVRQPRKWWYRNKVLSLT